MTDFNFEEAKDDAKKDPREFFAKLKEDSKLRNEENRNRKEYVHNNKEHEGMIIPFNAGVDFDPRTLPDNYIIQKYNQWAVTHTHEPRAMPGKLLTQSRSFLIDEETQEAAGFETKEEAIMAAHKNRMKEQNYKGGIYVVRNELKGWEVVEARNQDLEIPNTVTFDEAEQDWYRDL